MGLSVQDTQDDLTCYVTRIVTGGKSTEMAKVRVWKGSVHRDGACSKSEAGTSRHIAANEYRRLFEKAEVVDLRCA